MMKQLSCLAALAAATLLSGCANDPDAAARQLARNNSEYVTGSNLPRPKPAQPGGKISTLDAEELRRQLELSSEANRK
ncbi:MAG: hypothetical protein V4631_13830 [Pseudomonadota bacterium]